MAARLNSRQKFVPGGFQFYIPAIKWQSPRMASFDVIVQSAIAALQANPAAAASLGWDLSPAAMAERVDSYNANMCLAMGWNDYITAGGDSLPPKTMSPQSQQSLSGAAGLAKKIWSGVSTLNQWIDSSEPAVPQAEAERRAAICVACPLNGEGGLEKWFTKPASEAIKRQFERLASRKLATAVDEKLGICKACSCPMKLKVWTPMHFVQANLAPDVQAELKTGKNCWILE